jgi:hypothetical protein
LTLLLFEGKPTPTNVPLNSQITKNPEVRSAIEGVSYIAETMKSDEEANNVSPYCIFSQPYLSFIVRTKVKMLKGKFI